MVVLLVLSSIVFANSEGLSEGKSIEIHWEVETYFLENCHQLIISQGKRMLHCTILIISFCFLSEVTRRRSFAHKKFARFVFVRKSALACFQQTFFSKGNFCGLKTNGNCKYCTGEVA